MTIDARFVSYRMKPGARLDSGSNRTVAYDTIRNEGLSSYREPAFRHNHPCQQNTCEDVLRVWRECAVPDPLLCVLLESDAGVEISRWPDLTCAVSWGCCQETRVRAKHTLEGIAFMSVFLYSGSESYWTVPSAAGQAPYVTYSLCTYTHTRVHAVLMIRSQICPDILSIYAILDIISIPSNVKHVLAKWKWEDIFIIWPRKMSGITSTVHASHRWAR